MFTNPICHWSGGEALPLLNFAPGQAAAEYGTAAQLPVEQPFHYSAAAMASAGIVGAPAHIYGFQEAQGDPVVDLVGSDNLLPLGAGADVPYQNQPARGFYVSGTLDGSVKKAINFDESNTRDNRLEAANNTIFDYGAATSFVMFTVFRRAWRSSSLRDFYAKKNGTTTQGYSLIHNTGSLIFRCEETGGSNADSTVIADWYGYHWHYALVYFDRSDDTMRLCTDLGDGVEQSIAGWGTIASTQIFKFGYATNMYSYPGNMQIAYHAIWEGSEAESFKGSLAANRAELWTHGSSPANCPIDASPTSGVDGEQLTTIIGEDATNGTLFAAWTGQNNVRGFPFEYNENFTSANKLGVAIQDTDENELRDSDTISWSSGWNETNITYGTGGTPSETNPYGFRWANRLRSDGANAHIESTDMTCVAGERWSFGMAVIRNRRLEDVDVPSCRLIAWDDNANAEIDSVTFDATDKWQWIRLDDFTIPVGCVDVQFWVELPWGPVITHPIIGDSPNRFVNLCLCTAIRNAQQSHPIWKQDSAYGRFADNPILRYTGTPAGDFIKGSQGEIEVTFAGYGDFLHGTRVLYECLTGAAGAENRRIVRLNTSKQIEFLVYNSAGALVTTVTTAAIADLNTEHVIVCRWNTAGLPSGDKAEVSIDGGGYTGQNPAAWPASDTITDHRYGDDTGLTSSLNGTLASIRIWENPR